MASSVLPINDFESPNEGGSVASYQEKLAEFDRFYTSYVYLEIARTIKIVDNYEKLHQMNETKRIQKKTLKIKDESNHRLKTEISELEREEKELREKLEQSRKERLAYEKELKSLAASKKKQESGK
ncbi:Oidioi.mRNA.OKI2018_I69.chr2.g4353.t1.cds [Oikopleura dioica]|uniref:Oidioi.mRNA.OKI2018_I69.chr2.g4353.t1.cds n=1 Tax=Oikopleura dioica TaxID=34765 RepID=A0ABN7SYN9_OIKDI|nr:Oidioi.mRNA.OKI2018_I69.chr2.g4353.t1.cds [Oikopleura dioica]